MEDNHISEYNVESMFNFTRPTEYNTLFGRYLVTQIYVNHGNGTLSVLDTNKHPMVYHHLEVKIKKENDETVPHVSVFSWSKDHSGRVVELNDIIPPQEEDVRFVSLVHSFVDRVVLFMVREIPHSLCASGSVDNGYFVVSPEINAIESRILKWLKEWTISETAMKGLYFPVFRLDKQRGVFYYSRCIYKQPFIEFSSIDEFKKSEYYIQGSDVAPVVLTQQEECLLEVERQLIGTIN